MVAESILHRRSRAPVGGGERSAPVGAGGRESLAPRLPDTCAGGDRLHGVAAAVLESPPGRSAPLGRRPGQERAKNADLCV